MSSEDSRILFKKFCSDFIVIEKQGDNLCGTWNKDDLKSFSVLEPRVFEKPEFLTAEDMEGLQNVLDYKTKKFVINLQVVLLLFKSTCKLLTWNPYINF